jgi:hypothetical protein
MWTICGHLGLLYELGSRNDLARFRCKDTPYVGVLLRGGECWDSFLHDFSLVIALLTDNVLRMISS